MGRRQRRGEGWGAGRGLRTDGPAPASDQRRAPSRSRWRQLRAGRSVPLQPRTHQDAAHGSRATLLRSSGGAWAPVGGSPGFSPGGARYTSLALSPTGAPHVAFQDWANENRVTVMRYSGGAWELVGAAGFSPPTAAPLCLALDAAGSAYVAFQDATKGYRATVMKYPS